MEGEKINIIIIDLFHTFLTSFTLWICVTWKAHGSIFLFWFLMLYAFIAMLAFILLGSSLSHLEVHFEVYWILQFPINLLALQEFSQTLICFGCNFYKLSKNILRVAFLLLALVEMEVVLRVAHYLNEGQLHFECCSHNVPRQLIAGFLSSISGLVYSFKVIARWFSVVRVLHSYLELYYFLMIQTLRGLPHLHFLWEWANT